MYICEQCNHISASRYPAIKKVVRVREVNYPFRAKAQRQEGKCPNDPREDGRCKDDHGGKGTEIVKEILICRKCAIS